MCPAWPAAWPPGSRNVGGSQLVGKDGSNSRSLPTGWGPWAGHFPFSLDFDLRKASSSSHMFVGLKGSVCKLAPRPASCPACPWNLLIPILTLTFCCLSPSTCMGTQRVLAAHPQTGFQRRVGSACLSAPYTNEQLALVHSLLPQGQDPQTLHSYGSGLRRPIS